MYHNIIQLSAYIVSISKKFLIRFYCTFLIMFTQEVTDLIKLNIFNPKTFKLRNLVFEIKFYAFMNNCQKEKYRYEIYT